MNTKEAMGANTINTMLEALKTEFEMGIAVEMAILSNLADQALTTVTCTIPETVIDSAVAQRLLMQVNLPRLIRTGQLPITRES